MDTNIARSEVTAHSAGGAPFLFAFGTSLLATALLGLDWPVRTTALVLLLQGNVALPLAFLLERFLSWGRMSPGNPLKPLSVCLAMAQIAMLPVALLAFMLAPWSTGAAMGAIAGGHFVPYAWLQRTRTYAVLGAVVSVGTFLLTMTLKEQALLPTLVLMGVSYWIGGSIILARARRLSAADGYSREATAGAAA